MICVVALVSAVAAPPHIDVTRARPDVAIAPPVVASASASESTPRAADLVIARKTVTRALTFADLEAAYGRTTAPASIVAGAAVPVEVSVTNIGLLSWPASGEQAVHLAYHWFDASGKTVVWDGTRAVLERNIAPGETTALIVNVRAPEADGSYLLAWDMVREGSGWFSAGPTAMKTEPVAVGDSVTLALRAMAREAAISVGLDPDIFERQIMAESQFDPSATSPAGARGIAQLTPATARAWGVDPSDPVASLQAAAQHMAGYVKQYGNYPMALAAFNAGPGAVERYGGVPPFAETRNYISKILGSG